MKAKHSEHFKMTEKEFVYLSERVEVLGTIVYELCQNRLSELQTQL